MELREAATRRKIQALKSQLGHHSAEDGESRTPRKDSPHQPKMQKTAPFKQQNMPQSSPDGDPSRTAPKGHMTPPAREPNDHMTPHKTPTSSHMTSLQNQVISPASHMTSPANHGQNATATPPKDSQPVGYVVSPASYTILPATDHKTPPMSTPAAQKGHITSSPPAEKLTVPVEAKETEYMSEVQKQRARVTRIRKCIAAATAIQRAWRKHRSRVGVQHREAYRAQLRSHHSREHY